MLRRYYVSAFLNTVANTWNPGVGNTEAGLQQVQGQPGLHTKITTARKIINGDCWQQGDHRCPQTIRHSTTQTVQESQEIVIPDNMSVRRLRVNIDPQQTKSSGETRSSH